MTRDPCMLATRPRLSLVLLMLLLQSHGLAVLRSPRLLRGALPTRTAVATMALKTGIVGLPNVGKSTLFNAIMEETNAEAANYPFCTIEPNVGVVDVPDERLKVLSDINKSQKTVPTTLSFVDIAGLVAGASKGEGLGNQFLANIRECDAIVHVVRHGETWGDMGRYGEICGDAIVHVVRQRTVASLPARFGAQRLA